MKQPPVNTTKNFEVESPGSTLSWFAARYTDVYPKLVTIAAGVSGEYAAAEDIVQQAATIAWERFGQYQSGTNFTAWLAEIVRRVALNHRHRNERRRTFPSSNQTLDGLSAGTPSGHDPTRVVASGGQLAENQAAFDDQVVRALKGLEPIARSCLLLRVVHDLPYDEIALLLEIPTGTAMSHVHRSKKSLRQQLSSPTDPLSTSK